MIITETQRLLLLEFIDDDVGALTDILRDPQVMEFSSNGPYTEEETWQFIEGCQESYRQHGFGQWAVIERPSGLMTGFCGLSYVDLDGVQEVQIGYRLAQCAWGKGFASEAAAVALEYGFSQCCIDSIIAIIPTRHIASARVAEKVGLKPDSQTIFGNWKVWIYRKRRTTITGAA